MTQVKKKEQLKIDPSTASSRLKKELLFKYVRKAGDNFCFQCGAEIETSDELSVEHKIPWLNSENPVELFFNLENIAFSHLNCNISVARKIHANHGTHKRYVSGCRCDKCKEKQKIDRRNWRNKK